MSFYVLRIEQHGIGGEAAYRLQHAALHCVDIRRYILLDDGFYELPSGTYCTRRHGMTAENVRRLAYNAVRAIWPAEPVIECIEAASVAFSGLRKINAVEWDLEMASLRPSVEDRRSALSRSVALREIGRRLAASQEPNPSGREVFRGLAPIVRSATGPRPAGPTYEARTLNRVEQSPFSRAVQELRAGQK